jgi:peroxiredoxin
MSTNTSSSPRVGDSAPEFELFSNENEPWRLSEHLDDPVLLLFFPGAFTSVCTTELNTVNSDLDRFQDATVVGISTDSPFVLDEFRSVHGFDFPLLSDHSAKVSEMYGAKYQANFTPMNLDRISKRAAFVIDTEGQVRYREVLDNAGNVPDFDAIAEVLSEISES